jgi:hypothetical protein
MILLRFFHISMDCPKGDAMRKAWVVIFSLHACAHEPNDGVMRDLSCHQLPNAEILTMPEPEFGPGTRDDLQLLFDSLGWHRDVFNHRMLDELVMP